MGYAFPEEILEEVRVANGVYEVISEYVPLKKAGASYRGLCPFHTEKTPSFFVNPERQIFHCFGCGAGGNVFSFVMRYENVGFPEAVRQLADRAGIHLPTRQGAVAADEGLKPRILEANAEALRFFEAVLGESKGGAACRDYLKQRGVTRDEWKKFRLGLSPDGWDGLLKHLRKKGVDEELMAKAGLVVAKKSGSGHYDRFRGRLMFPITDVRGDVVAFGGRLLTEDKEQPKYLNSPETAVYRKGKTLYGLDVARATIRETGYAVIVEGYLDAMAAHRAGAANTVATLGTALTKDHLRLIKRFAEKMVFVFDADVAGLEATKRSLQLVFEEEMIANTAALPAGHDPDSFVRAEGPEAFMETLRNSKPLMDFFIEKTLEKWSGGGIEGKAKAFDEMIPVLSAIGNRIRRSEYVRKVSQLLDVREEVLTAELSAREKGTPATRTAVRSAPRETARRHPEEEELVRAMLLDQRLVARVRDEVPLSLYRDERCRAVAASVYEEGVRGTSRKGAGHPTLPDVEAAALAAGLVAEERGEEDLEMTVGSCLDKMRRARVKKELSDLQDKIRQAEAAGDQTVVDSLLRIKQTIANA